MEDFCICISLVILSISEESYISPLFKEGGPRSGGRFSTSNLSFWGVAEESITSPFGKGEGAKRQGDILKIQFISIRLISFATSLSKGRLYFIILRRNIMTMKNPFVSYLSFWMERSGMKNPVNAKLSWILRFRSGWPAIINIFATIFWY